MSSKLALIIGNSHYQDPNLAKLVAPGEDVNDLAVVLRDPAIGGFDRVITLIDQTDAVIRLGIEDFFAEKKPDDLLVLYFSGHGVRDEQGRLYLAAPNTRANRLRATAIAADFITIEMDRSRSKRQVLILDCCHSGAFAQGSKAETGGSVGTGPAFEGTGYGRVVLTATDATQYAWEGDKIIGDADNSVFTHYLVQGLQTGEADIDADGRITLDELYDYVYGQVVAKTPKQTPGKWSYKQQGDIVIARNPTPIVKPAELPADLKTAIESPFSNVRVGAVRELERLLNGSNASLALAAFDAIKRLVGDDSRSVSGVASSVLTAYAEKQRLREEEEQLAKDRAEQVRLAIAQAEAERDAAVKAEQARFAEAQRQAALEAEQARLAAERAEAERQAAVKAEQDRIAKERAEAERQATIKAEQDRVARAETERRAALKAEQDRIAAERAAALTSDAIRDTDKRAAVSTTRLVVQRGPNAGETFTLQAGLNIIGRASGAAIRLSDTLISRQHVRLNVTADRVTLEDLGSANGTFVNERKISGSNLVTLNDGDTITIGDTVLVLQASARVPATETQLPRVEPLPKPVDDQPTRLAPIGGFQPTPVVPTSRPLSSSAQPLAQPTSIAAPTVIAALGFGLTYGLLSPLIQTLGGDAFEAFVLLVVAAVLPWAVMRMAFQKLGIYISWRRTIAIVFAWNVANAISLVIAFVFGSSIHSYDLLGYMLIAVVFSAISGSIGGYLTGRILHPLAPALRLKLTTLRWAIAWVVGTVVVMTLLISGQGGNYVLALGLCGALIGAIGCGSMFRQIAQGV